MNSLKADLHVHSRFSTRPSYWVLQKLGCAESYVDPLSIYEYAQRKGMNFVTITDHNSPSAEYIHQRRGNHVFPGQWL